MGWIFALMVLLCLGGCVATDMAMEFSRNSAANNQQQQAPER